MSTKFHILYKNGKEGAINLEVKKDEAVGGVYEVITLPLGRMLVGLFD